MRAGAAARVGPESMVLPVMLPLAASIVMPLGSPESDNPTPDRRHTPLRSRLVSRKDFSGRRGGDLKFTTDKYCVSTARPLRTCTPGPPLAPRLGEPAAHKGSKHDIGVETQ